MENLHLTYREVVYEIPYRNLVLMQRDKLHTVTGTKVTKVKGKDMASRRRRNKKIDMAILYFKVSSDYDEVIRLRQECEKLEAQLKKMDVNKSPAAAKALEAQLAAARQQMMGLVTEAAKAGAVMENDLKIS